MSWRGAALATETHTASNYRLQQLRRVFRERFEFEAYLGKGASASVYLVRNLRLDRLEALKVLTEAHDDTDMARRFVAEARLVASLDHPNIVKVYDSGTEDAIAWCSMQHINGPTLRAELAARGRFEAEQVVGLAIPLLDALDYSHHQSIIHRDVKPTNIILSLRGRPFLMDFGIAKSVHTGLKTMTGRVLGTPTYMAPEQAEGQELDGRADLYSLGTTLYELLAGRPPFLTKDFVQAMMRRLREDATPLSQHVPSIAPPLEAAIMRSLERQRDQRYSSAEEMRNTLAALSHDPERRISLIAAPQQQQQLAEDPTVTLDTHPVTGEALGKKRRRGLGLAAALVLLLALVVTTWLRLSSAPEEDTASAASPPVAEALPTADNGVGDANQEEGSGPDVPAEAPVEPGDNAPETSSSVQASSTPDEGLDSDPSAEDARPREAPPPAVPPKQAAARPPVAPPVAAAPVRRPVVQPKLLESSQPALSPEQATLCANKDVIVSLQVGDTGRVTRVRVLSSSEASCEEPARETAMRYRFEPAKDAEGLPVPGSTTMAIQF